MPRAMEIVTPLGEDVLLFHGMHGREELGRVSEYQVDLLSARDDVDVDAILGQNVTLTVTLPDEATRYFNGFVTRFGARGHLGRYYRYHATVRPWIWFLTRTADCRIFQGRTVPEIAETVFSDHPTADFVLELTGSYPKWDYCVQYRETDFNFVSRLFEHEGIYYYFRHTDGHNTLVLTDSMTQHVPFPGYAELPFLPGQPSGPDRARITSWEFSREIQPGVYVHDHYDLERPSVELRTQRTLARSYEPSRYEVYDYPGAYTQTAEGERYAEVRIEELGAQFEAARAATNAEGVTVGYTLTVTGHPRIDPARQYLIVAADYDLEYSTYQGLPPGTGQGSRFRCRFVAMSMSDQFRPRRSTPKPFVQGPQTAVVVGPSGDEIYTDQYGRVKVQFHWDRRGGHDQSSSCWIRVSQPWAGKGWGMVAIPRVGQEVIVDFLEGDPDQPIITGRVYNAEQMPPYDLPANKTQSGIKSRSSMGGGGGNFNEIRMEDRTGSEQLFVHAEKNQDIEVEHDETHWVGHDRTKTVGHNETITVHGARTETVDKDETITIHADRTETVDGNETITVGAGRTHTVAKSEAKTVARQRTHSVGINETISVGAAQEITVGSTQTISVGANQTVSVGANQTTTVGSNQSTSVGSDMTTSIGKNAATMVGADESHTVSGGRSTSVGKDDATKVAKNFVVDAGDSIAIKTGSASITMKKDGTIVIKGKDITIQGSGKIAVQANGDVVMKGSKIEQN